LHLYNFNNYTHGFTNNEPTTINAKEVNNEETLKKRRQAAERKRRYRARKRQQQNAARVMCYTVSDKQLTTSPHIEQVNGPTDSEPSAKRLHLDNCKNYTQGVTNNEPTTITAKEVTNEEKLKKRRQAAERKRRYRERKRQQQNTTRVMCYTASDEQLTILPHTEQLNGPTAAAETCVRQLGEPLAKCSKVDDCNRKRNSFL
jgi:hypothetical protein